jgi:hypothetical protein
MIPITAFRMVLGVAAVIPATVTVTAVLITTIRIIDAAIQCE